MLVSSKKTRLKSKYSHVVPNYRPHALFMPHTYAPKADPCGDTSEMATIVATNNNIRLTLRYRIPPRSTEANQRSFGWWKREEKQKEKVKAEAFLEGG